VFIDIWEVGGTTWRGREPIYTYVGCSIIASESLIPLTPIPNYIEKNYN